MTGFRANSGCKSQIALVAPVAPVAGGLWWVAGGAGVWSRGAGGVGVRERGCVWSRGGGPQQVQERGSAPARQPSA